MMSDGQFFHDSITLEKDSWLTRFTEGKSGVQFVHRTMAYVVVGLILFLFLSSKNTPFPQKLSFFTIYIGCFTLLNHVPLWLGVTHQAVAFFLLAAITYTTHRFTK